MWLKSLYLCWRLVSANEIGYCCCCWSAGLLLCCWAAGLKIRFTAFSGAPLHCWFVASILLFSRMCRNRRRISAPGEFPSGARRGAAFCGCPFECVGAFSPLDFSFQCVRVSPDVSLCAWKLALVALEFAMAGVGGRFENERIFMFCDRERRANAGFFEGRAREWCAYNVECAAWLSEWACQILRSECVSFFWFFIVFRFAP